MRSRACLLAVALLLGACGEDKAAETPLPADPVPTEAAVEELPPAPTVEAPPTGSSDGSSPAVNSITADPKDGTIMIGTGPGLYRVPPGATKAEELTGTISTPEGQGSVSGNLVVRFAGEGTLLGSGHPEPGSTLPENLGLMRSSDGGQTWEVVSGLGEGDYHELEAVGDLILAVNVESPDILVSRDGGQSFEARTPPAAPIDVVVDPKDPDVWAVSTEQGTFSSTNGGDSWRPRDTTFGARLMWPDSDALYSVDRNGKVRLSKDGGKGWEDRGDVGGLPSAVTTGRKDELLAAIIGGKVQRSRDGGKSWDTAATLP